MMKLHIVVIVALLIQWMVFEEVRGQIVLKTLERCTRNTDSELEKNKNCQLWHEKLDTGSKRGPYMYCNANSLCKDKTRKAYAPDENQDLALDQFCSTGLHPGESGTQVTQQPGGRTSRACFALANWGCTIPTAKQSHTVCFDKKALNNNQCEAPTEETPTTVVVGVGQECGKQNTDNPPKDIVCGHNLVCNSKRVCEARSSIGESCSGDGTVGRDNHHECMKGLSCQNHRCVRKYNLPRGASCHADEVCASGICGESGHCQASRSNEVCTKDADCNFQKYIDQGVFDPRTYSVCRTTGAQTFEKEGKCSAFYLPQLSRLERCYYEKCYAEQGHKKYKSVCAAEDARSPSHPCHEKYVKWMCAKTCIKPVDRRYVYDVPYTFDCDEGVASAFGSSSCEVTQQFRNCEAVLGYPSGASQWQLSSAVIGVLAIVGLAMM